MIVVFFALPELNVKKIRPYVNKNFTGEREGKCSLACAQKQPCNHTYEGQIFLSKMICVLL